MKFSMLFLILLVATPLVSCRDNPDNTDSRIINADEAERN